MALFVALGGTGAYAANEFTGDDIQSESLTGADFQGKSGNATTPAVNGTISSADIAGQAPNDNGQPFVAGTIKGWDVFDRSLKPEDLAPESLTAAELGEGSVGSSEVKDDLLTTEDYRASHAFSARINGFAASGTQYGAIKGISNASHSPDESPMFSPNREPAGGQSNDFRIRLSAPVASGAERRFAVRFVSPSTHAIGICTVGSGEQGCDGSTNVNYSVQVGTIWQVETSTTGIPGAADAQLSFHITESP